MAQSPYWWHRQTIAETFERILNRTTPWVAIGDFLDDWRRSAVEDRYELVEAPIASASTPEMLRWAAFCASMVEWLCWQDDLPFPSWTGQECYILEEPWFIYDGWRLRAWQLVMTPAAFKTRNIHGGDRMLNAYNTSLRSEKREAGEAGSGGGSWIVASPVNGPVRAQAAPLSL